MDPRFFLFRTSNGQNNCWAEQKEAVASVYYLTFYIFQVFPPSSHIRLDYRLMKLTLALTFMHLHFKCSGCGTISCLTNSKINGYELPEGFIKQDVQFLIIGICHECNNKAI